jgi:hypothetical protein
MLKWTASQFIPHIVKEAEKKNYPCNRPWRPIGLWDIEVPAFSRVGSQMVVRLSALCASRPLPPGRFLVLISFRGWVDPRAQWHWESNPWPSGLFWINCIIKDYRVYNSSSIYIPYFAYDTSFWLYYVDFQYLICMCSVNLYMNSDEIRPLKRMYVCIRGGPQESALAPQPLKINFACPFD